ncbi:MAG TPA: DUF4126 domain-containing protein [Anaerolineae bacterium]|nr:DUF4126 domain-containing protein [Anaerolineae bacterium]HQH39933.1 DUF4126 domain-containing protein [Anaerolineae bacterium]
MIDGLLNLASAFGLSTSAGLNAYIPMLVLALLARFTSLVELGEPWSALTSGWIIGLLVILLLVEILADKIPAVDTANDVIQTIVRPAAGAIVFAATTQNTIHLHPVLAFACGVVLAGGVHMVKAGGRPVVTATTGGVGNPIVSTLEDITATVTSLAAVIFPYLMLAWLFLLVLLFYLFVRRRRQRAEARATASRAVARPMQR